MPEIRRSSLRKQLRKLLRLSIASLPSSLRFAVYRLMVDCDPDPPPRLILKIAETREELEQCFRILHDAYVDAGFMKPDASGMRATPYHALPTTTTLCAKYDERVVGTISMIREGVFGFPLQAVFDLERVRSKGGQIAEISALAVHPDFRKTGGAILFPLMKFMHQYCTEFFDTRHLVIAVNPDRIELYEALLFFERLQETTVAEYDFANGAPAVGACLDLKFAREIFRAGYRGRPARKNMHRYFFELTLKNIELPRRRYFTTNDPVMTPELLDYFFNQKTQVFKNLDDRRKQLLWSIYDAPEYRGVLPMLQGTVLSGHPLRQHQRFSIRCPATVVIEMADGPKEFPLDVIELSFSGFQAECKLELPTGSVGHADVELGKDEHSRVTIRVMRRKDLDAGSFYGFKLDEPDGVWRRCVAALEMGQTSGDLLQ
ncbi:MAG: GNAT family N-acetyltransferase [Paucibacter sp.]|nr:GNAT family N-acetyltransferase [Roseateles sp.]